MVKWVRHTHSTMCRWRVPDQPKSKYLKSFFVSVTLCYGYYLFRTAEKPKYPLFSNDIAPNNVVVALFTSNITQIVVRLLVTMTFVVQVIELLWDKNKPDSFLCSRLLIGIQNHQPPFRWKTKFESHSYRSLFLYFAQAKTLSFASFTLSRDSDLKYTLLLSL